MESANALPTSAVDVDVVVINGGGTTTTVIDGGSNAGGGGGGGAGGGGGRGVVEDGEKRRKAEVMVSRSVQVESHPIRQGPGGVGIGVIPPAHLKR